MAVFTRLTVARFGIRGPAAQPVQLTDLIVGGTNRWVSKRFR